MNTMSKEMRAFCGSEENRKAYSAYRFDRQTESQGGNAFNDAIIHGGPYGPFKWPRRIEFQFSIYGARQVLGYVSVMYDTILLQHGTRDTTGKATKIKVVDFTDDEWINQLDINVGPPQEKGFTGIIFLAWKTNKGKYGSIGKPNHTYPRRVVRQLSIGGNKRLKGFYGGADGVIDSLGGIWAE